MRVISTTIWGEICALSRYWRRSATASRSFSSSRGSYPWLLRDFTVHNSLSVVCCNMGMLGLTARARADAAHGQVGSKLGLLFAHRQARWLLACKPSCMLLLSSVKHYFHLPPRAASREQSARASGAELTCPVRRFMRQVFTMHRYLHFTCSESMTSVLSTVYPRPRGDPASSVLRLLSKSDAAANVPNAIPHSKCLGPSSVRSFVTGLSLACLKVTDFLAFQPSKKSVQTRSRP